MRHIRIEANDEASAIMTLGCLGFFVLMMGAWGTHVVWIIKVLASDKGATVGQMALGVLGSFFFPIGMVHGVMIWLGVS